MVVALSACGEEDPVVLPTQAPASTVPAFLKNNDETDYSDIDYDALANVDQTEAPEPFDTDAVSKKLNVEVVEFHPESSNGTDLYLLVTNNSDVTCDVTAKAVYYDKDGIILDTQETTELAFAPGTTIVMSVCTSRQDWDKYEYTVTPKAPSDDYLPVDKDMTVNLTTAADKDGLIVSVTNNSSLTVDAGFCWIFYYSGNKLVRVGQCAPVGEDDRTIQPGATVKAKDTFPKDLTYDSYKYYYHAYASADDSADD